MFKTSFVLISILLCMVMAPAQQKVPKLTDLTWLSGCWESRDTAKQMSSLEQWMAPDGGLMLGMGRTVKNGKAVDWEFMRIEQRGSDLVFIARPRQNKDETPFILTRLERTEAVFENPEHDFPQRVIYRRDGEKLTGRIEGKENGKALEIDFPFVRSKCR